MTGTAKSRETARRYACCFLGHNGSRTLIAGGAGSSRDRAERRFCQRSQRLEIAIKVGLGKWPEARDLLFDFERHMDDAGFESLKISVAHVRTAGLMSAAHRDPFDRILAAQATMEGLVLATADPDLATLGAVCVW